MNAFLPYLWAFLVGGAICVVAQVLIDRTSLTPARILVLYVVMGVALGALGVYEPLVNFAGAGATVPLSGCVAEIITNITITSRRGITIKTVLMYTIPTKDGTSFITVYRITTVML